MTQLYVPSHMGHFLEKNIGAKVALYTRRKRAKSLQETMSNYGKVNFYLPDNNSNSAATIHYVLILDIQVNTAPQGIE